MVCLSVFKNCCHITFCLDIFDYIDDIQVEEYPDQQKRDNVDECFDDNVDKMYQKRIGIKIESLHCEDDSPDSLAASASNISLNQSSITSEPTESLNQSMVTEKSDLLQSSSAIESPLKCAISNQSQENLQEDESSKSQEETEGQGLINDTSSEKQKTEICGGFFFFSV